MENQKTAEKATAEQTKKFFDFLPHKIIDVKPIEAGVRWSGLLTNSKDLKNEPYLFEKVTRSFSAPMNPESKGGGVKRVLDNVDRFFTMQYPDMQLTEEEFFAKLFGVDMSITNMDANNFWKTDKRSRVIIPRKGIKLVLSNPADAIKYKVLKANTRRIAPDYESRFNQASYEFMFVDSGKLIDKRVEEASIKAKAYAMFDGISGDLLKMKDYIRAVGHGLPSNPTMNWLKNELLKDVEADPKKFIDIIDDKFFKDKVLISKAIEVGAIRKKGSNKYCLEDNTDIGDIVTAINFLNNPENSAFKARIVAQIGMAKL